MTTTPSLLDLADGAAEAIRALNHRTLGGWGEPVAPSDLCEILGALSVLAARLPQLLGQLGATLDRQLRSDQLTVDSWALTDAATLVAEVEHALQVAGQHATQLGSALDAGHEAAAHLAVRNL